MKRTAKLFSCKVTLQRKKGVESVVVVTYSWDGNEDNEEKKEVCADWGQAAEFIEDLVRNPPNR